eukprot:3211506-Pleurochrysis_carterae.AAC.1
MPSLLRVLTRWALSVNQATKQREHACVAIARALKGDELVDTSGDLALEELAVGCCKLVKEAFVLVGVSDGEIVDANIDEEKRTAALEGKDARFAPNCVKP